MTGWTSIITSAVAGIIIAALTLADLAYPRFGGAQIIATAQSSAVLLYLVFVASDAFFSLLLWFLDVIDDLAIIRRFVGAASTHGAKRDKRILVKVFGQTQIAPIIDRLSPEHEIFDDVEAPAAVMRFGFARALRGELWRIIARRLIGREVAVLAVAIGCAWAVKRFAANQPAPDIALTPIVTAIALLIVVIAIGWVWIDREIERTAALMASDAALPARQSSDREEVSTADHGSRMNGADYRRQIETLKAALLDRLDQLARDMQRLVGNDEWPRATIQTAADGIGHELLPPTVQRGEFVSRAASGATDADASLAAQLERVEGNVAQLEATVREELRALAVTFGAFSTALETPSRQDGSPAWAELAPALDRLRTELVGWDAVDRQMNERWKNLETALAEIRASQQELTIAVTHRTESPLSMTQAEKPSAKSDPVTVARKVRAMLAEIGSTPE